MNPEEINDRLTELRGGIQWLAAFAELDDEQRAQWDAATDEFEQLSERAADIQARAEMAKRAADIPNLEVHIKRTTEDVLNDRAATPTDYVDTVTRSLEARRDINADGIDTARQLMLRHRDDVEHGVPIGYHWAKTLAARSTDLYSTAWSKMITGRGEFMSPEERTTMAVGTNADGGFLVPTHLDPSLIMTNTGGVDVVRPISRVVTTIGQANVWNGVTSAGSTFSMDAELTEVSDDSPAFGRVSIPVHKAQGWIEASLEMLDDTNIQSDLGMLIADGRDRLEATQHVTGAGTGANSTGINTALDANTNVEIAVTTAATLGLVDIDAVYTGVKVRWRASGQWLAHPVAVGKIRALASTAGLALETVNLASGSPTTMYGKPINETDELSATPLTGNGTSVLIYGDFSNYVIVDKPGSFAVQFVPTVFSNTTNRPDGRVGWYVHWRTGADSVLDTAFRLLQNKT